MTVDPRDHAERVARIAEGVFVVTCANPSIPSNNPAALVARAYELAEALVVEGEKRRAPGTSLD